MTRKFAFAPVVTAADLGERKILVVASDPTVDRTKDIMRPEGCVLENYLKNPIVLADHDPTKPIGTAEPVVKNGRVEALITFAPAGISAKADEYCGLAKAGVLRTVSVGFDPIDAEPIKGGGLDYKSWELMEISLVAVPANPSAQVIARALPGLKAAGDWKVGASRNLPASAAAWDAEAAAAAIFAHCGFDGPSPDATFARKGFLAYDAAKPADKASYRLPFATVVAGRLTAIPSGVRAAASRLPRADIPEAARVKARAVLDHYEAQMKNKGGSAFRIKGLYAVAQLAGLLAALGWAHRDALDEAVYEGDSSKVPALLADALKALADAFVAMSAEEAAELLASGGLGDDADDGEAGEPVVKRRKAWDRVVAKSGRALSAANAEHVAAIAKCFDALAKCHVKAADLHDELHATLADMQGHGTSAGDHVKALMRLHPDAADEEGDDDETESSRDPEADPEDDPDNELAFQASARKRAVAIASVPPAP